MTSYIKKPLFLIFVLLILVAPISSVFAQADPPAEERALEIVYPVFNNLTLSPETGLPQYVQYLFRFAMAIIGLIILYVMISAGITYIMSTGNATQLLEAKNSILASFLGAIILISAFVLFNSINPNLTDLGGTDEDLTAIEPIIIPGIYLCNYNTDGGAIEHFILQYKHGSLEEKIEASRGLKDVMNNDQGSCYRVKFSANLSEDDLSFYMTNTMFVIPKRIHDNPDTPDTDESDWEYNYGIVFHEEDNWKGRCSFNFDIGSYVINENPAVSVSSALFPPFGEFGAYNRAKSVTLFEKPTVEITSTNTAVSLFQCLDYNTTNNCPPGVATGRFASFPTDGGSYSGYITEVPRSVLDRSDLAGYDVETLSIDLTGDLNRRKALGARSIRIDPPNGAFFAIMFSEDNHTGKTCEVISKSDNNLLDQPIGQCGNKCKGTIADEKKFLRDCIPCLKSMIVIKGNVIY